MAAKVAVARRQLDHGDPAHELLGAPPVLDEVGDGDHLQAVPAAVRRRGRARGHGAVVVHDLADDGRRAAGRRDARGPRRPRSARCARARRPGGRSAGRRGPAGRGRAGRSSGSMATWIVRARSAAEMPVVTPSRASIDAVKAVWKRAWLLRDHRAQVELVAALRREREADQAAAVGGHEVDRLGRDELGGHREVALVLAVLVVADDDHPAGAHVVEGLLDRGERRRLAPGVGRRAAARGGDGCARLLARGRLRCCSCKPRF